jgi:hypothetical protein
MRPGAEVGAMAEQPTRTIFRDGSILPAADLELMGRHARSQLARHERGLHTPGIGEGLQLLTTPSVATANGDTVEVVQVRLATGLAITGSGREVVVAEEVPITEDMVVSDVNDPANAEISLPYPVFLVGIDTEVPAQSFGARPCSGPGGPTRIREGYEVQLGMPGEELQLADQRRPSPDADLNGDGPTWRLLLGFVRLHLGAHRFVSVSGEQNDVRPAYAGVRADDVVSRSDHLTIRTGDLESTPGRPAIRLDPTDGGRLVFGPTTATGGVQESFWVNAKGDVKANGVVNPGLVAGSVWVESGTISTGLTIPLPDGVDEAKVAAGDVIVHVTVQPRLVGGDADLLIGAHRITVDPTRRVSVTLRAGTTQASHFNDIVGACDYVIVAAVPPKGGGGQP